MLGQTYAMVALAAITLANIATSSEAAPLVRDHRHSSSGIQVNAPPSVDKDTGTANRAHGGVSVGISNPSKLRVYTTDKNGEPNFRRCDVGGRRC